MLLLSIHRCADVETRSLFEGPNMSEKLDQDTCPSFRATAAHFLFALLMSAGLIIAGAKMINAQTSTPLPAGSPSPSPAPSTMPGPPPKVTAIDQGHLELDDIIRVEVDHLSEWAANHDASKLVPYLNGRAIRGNYPEEIHASKNHLHFHLRITPENKSVWVDLLGAPEGMRHPVTFSVGLENQSPFDSVYDLGNEQPLTVISPVYGIVSLLVVIITLILLVWLARTTNLI